MKRKQQPSYSPARRSVHQRICWIPAPPSARVRRAPPETPSATPAGPESVAVDFALSKCGCQKLKFAFAPSALSACGLTSGSGYGPERTVVDQQLMLIGRSFCTTSTHAVQCFCLVNLAGRKHFHEGRCRDNDIPFGHAWR